MFFAKGEIIMNNIYKVIWSKAKNCYVVASEIARSHTKSASGSEKIGGVARHALLALGAACAIACGGFVNVGAADTVHVDESSTPPTAHEVYTKAAVDTTFATKTEVNAKLDSKADKTDVVKNTKDIATNKGNITKLENEKLRIDVASATYATKTELSAKADATALGEYAKTADVNTELANKADQADLDTANGKITDLQKKTDKLSPDGKELTGMTTVSGTTVSGDNVKAGELTVTGEIKDGAGVTTTLAKINDSMTQTATNTGEIANLKTKTDGQQTAINGLNEKTTQISYNAAEGTTVHGVKFKDTEVDANGKGLTGVSTLNTTGDATVGGALKADSLIVENASNLKGDVTMDKTLKVTGDTTLKGTKVDGKLTVTDDAELKNTTVGSTLGVTGATTLSGELTAEKNATFEKDVTVKGTTNLKDTNVEGNLKVTGTITTNKMIFGEAPDNYTEIDKGKVTSKNSGINGAGESITSSSTFDAEKNEVGIVNNGTGDHSYHKQTSDGIIDNVYDLHNSNNRTQTKTETSDTITDENGNTSTTSQTASKNETSLKDKDGKNTNTTIDTAKGYDKTIEGENGKTSTKQEAGSISSTVYDKDGNIKASSEMKEDGSISNNATGNMTNIVGGTLTTTVAGQATEEFNSGLNTTVNGTENHKVNGTQNIHVTGKQTNTVEGGQENIISGGQINKITGDQTTEVTNGNISNTATNITNTANEKLTDQVGTNTRVTTSTSITDTVGTANRKIENDKITDTAGDFTVTTDKENGTTFAKTGSTATYSTKAGAPTDTNIAGNLIKTGRVEANELGVSDEDGDNTANLTVKAGEDGGVNASASKGTSTGSLDVKGDKVESSVKDGDKANTVTSTADGTTFNNSKANTVFEGGRYTDTTIKGNTITTGHVTMDYAEVMKDLGVNGNAKIDGQTTTGSLEVTGTSTLKGDVTMESNATVGKNLSVGEAVTAKYYKVGGNTYIDANGINANNQKITNVADGSISEGSKDAVNGGQLYGVKRDLEHQVDKVGANAAAMANLRPMEFDPSSKWNIAAAIGNYGSETAAALGAFYRPNDNVMVNLSTAFGTGENMVGGGVSVRLGKGGNKLSREETNALKAQVNDLTARMDALLSVLNPNMSKDFPDVPENHWAYEAVSRLAGNDIVQGYPDGEFHGERTMTRYEMAEIIYNALSRGAEAERELVEEFKPELQAMAASEKATAEKAEG